MKKILIVLLSILLVMACVGCGSVNTTSNKYSNDNFSSDEPASSVDSTVEDDKPHGIEGLIDEDDSPAGKTYLGVSGDGFTTYFAADGRSVTKWIATGEQKPADKWEKLPNGQIKKVYSKNSNVVNYYFLYEDFMVSVETEYGWGSVKGTYDTGYELYAKISDGREIILNKDGTYINTYSFGNPKGTYKICSERMIKIKSTTDMGENEEKYYFIDNDNCLHLAFPEVK